MVERFKDVLCQFHCKFISWLSHKTGCWPVFGACFVVRSHEAQAGNLAIFRLVIDIETTDHGSLVHKGKFVDYPWNTTNLGTNLGDKFADDDPKILAVVDRARQYGLRYDRDLLRQELFQVWIKI